MKCNLECNLICAASLSIFLASTAALANGAFAGFPAGGVVFKQAKNISIAREDLDIGLDRIHVHYVFISSARRPVQRTIGFPMAKVQQDDSPNGIGNTSRAENGQEVRNYMAFKVSVNGRPVTPKLHEYAWSGDTNITRKLRAMDVPVFAATAEAYKKLAQLPEETVRKLEREKLAVKDENGAWLVPQWLYQTVYEWRQTFAPGKTEVDISYKPLYGASNDYQYYYEGGKGAPLYCLDGGVKKKLTELKAQGKSPEPLTVGYILKTVKNWRGPIGEFHLNIVEKNSFSSFCAPNGLKASDDGKSWQAKNFVPGADLNIVFYQESGS